VKDFAFILLILFIQPLCATIAGLITWAEHHDESIDDGRLVRKFLFTLIVCLIISFGAMRTNTVYIYLDPAFRLQTEMDAHPVYAAIKASDHDDYEKLHNFLLLQVAQGKRLFAQGETLSNAFLQARPLLSQMTTHNLGFSDQKSKLTWGRVTADSLKELESQDAALCYQALSLKPLDGPTLAHAFSAGNTKAFQQAVVDVYKSVEFDSFKRIKRDQSVEHDAVALEYRSIYDLIVQQHGKPIADQLTQKQFPEQPIAPPEQICTARIAQIEAILKRPQAMAARLIDGILR
jgi:hypothetical protein